MAVHSQRRELAQELVLELIEDARREAERDRAREERVRALVRAGKAIGLKPTQLGEAAGLSRQAIYEIQGRGPSGPTEDLESVVLASVAAGATTREALASALRMEEEPVSAAIEGLTRRGAVGFASAGYEGGTSTEILLLTREGEWFLEDLLRRAVHSRPEGWTAYLMVDEDEAQPLQAAAEERFGRNRTALLSRTTRGDMDSAELAISFDVGDQVGLFNAAAAAWHSLRADLDLEPAPPRIAAFAAPRIRSATLEAFARGIAETAPKLERRAMRLAADAQPQGEELDLCVRALGEAAAALRLAAGAAAPAAELRDGEVAFAELQAVSGLRLDPRREAIQKALIPALERATARLGPFPGGRVGSFRGPGEALQIVEEVNPSPADLVAIAGDSGRALGFAQLALKGEVDALEAIRRVGGLGPAADRPKSGRRG